MLEEIKKMGKFEVALMLWMLIGVLTSVVGCVLQLSHSVTISVDKERKELDSMIHVQKELLEIQEKRADTLMF